MGERRDDFHDRPRPPLVRVGDRVRVKEGPNQGQAGKVVYRSPVSVHVDLGRPVPTVVKLDAIEAEGMPDRWGSPGEPKQKRQEHQAPEPVEEERQVEPVEEDEPEPEPAPEPAPLASNGNKAMAEQDLDRQLAAVQQLMTTLQAGSVQVSGRIRLELAVEVEL